MLTYMRKLIQMLRALFESEATHSLSRQHWQTRPSRTVRVPSWGLMLLPLSRLGLRPDLRKAGLSGRSCPEQKQMTRTKSSKRVLNLRTIRNFSFCNDVLVSNFVCLLVNFQLCDCSRWKFSRCIWLTRYSRLYTSRSSKMLLVCSYLKVAGND